TVIPAHWHRTRGDFAAGKHRPITPAGFVGFPPAMPDLSVITGCKKLGTTVAPGDRRNARFQISTQAVPVRPARRIRKPETMVKLTRIMQREDFEFARRPGKR